MSIPVRNFGSNSSSTPSLSKLQSNNSFPYRGPKLSLAKCFCKVSTFSILRTIK